MKITGLQEQVKDSNRVNVFVDGTYSLSLTLDQILDQKIKVGIELGAQQLSQLKKYSDEGKLCATTLDWLLRRPHSTKELKDYLYRKKADPELIESFTSRLTAKGYINDTKFVEWWVAGRTAKNKSLMSITSELKAKGITAQLTQQVATQLQNTSSELDSGFDKTSLTALVQKLKTRSKYNDQNKLIRYLLSKGFRYADIKQELSNQG